jgi:hypothetical protein
MVIARINKEELEQFKGLNARIKVYDKLIDKLIDDMSEVELAYNKLWSEIGDKYSFNPAIGYTLNEKGEILFGIQAGEIH